MKITPDIDKRIRLIALDYVCSGKEPKIPYEVSCVKAICVLLRRVIEEFGTLDTCDEGR